MADEKEIERLIEKLQGTYWNEREWAARTLLRIAEKGGDCSAAIPTLINTLKDRELTVRESAAKALAKIGVNEEQFNEINRMLKERKSWGETDGAFRALVEIGEPAVPAFIDALKDKDIRKDAAYALGKMGYPVALPVLTEALKDKDSIVRERAIDALGIIVEKTADVGDYSSALKIIKDSTTTIMEFYSGKKDRKLLTEKREVLGKIAEATQKIHDKMNVVDTDKKFPVKHQPIGTVRRKVIANG